MSTTTQAQHTLNKPYAAMYLISEADRRTDSDLLLTMNRRRKKSGPEKDALWSGSYQLERLADDHLREAINLGVLLFVGQPTAIEAARTFERQRRAAR